MRLWRSLALSTIALMAAAPAFAQGPADVPRNETLIVENPEGTIKNAGWFNIWATNAGGQSTGLHQLAMDTFWYIDPDHGLDGVFDNSLASEPPIYNDDFTELTVKLRPGIYWSDGVEFTADDVVFTTETHLNTNGLVRSAQYQFNVESVEAPDKYTVVFKLKKPNSRFHSLFTVRWNAAWMMPKHIFEGQDPLTFDFNPPVSLGAYTMHSYDPNGQWFTWQKRDDWERTTLGRFGEPGPKFVTYLDPGPPDKRVIAQLNHDLDIIHDTSPEGVFTLVEQSPEFDRLVPRLPLRPSGPDAAAGHLQPPQREVPGSRRPLGAGAGARHQADRDGVLSRRGDDLGDRGSADRDCAGLLPQADAGVAHQLRARHRQAGDQAVRPDRRPADRRDAAAQRRRPDPDRPRGDRRVARSRLVEAGPDRGGGTARARRLHPSGQRLVHAERRAVQDHGDGRGRSAPGDDPRRLADRRAVAAVRHRRHHRVRRRRRS